jgi:hypothetical protein
MKGLFKYRYPNTSMDKKLLTQSNFVKGADSEKCNGS